MAGVKLDCFKAGLLKDAMGKRCFADSWRAKKKNGGLFSEL